MKIATILTMIVLTANLTREPMPAVQIIVQAPEMTQTVEPTLPSAPAPTETPEPGGTIYDGYDWYGEGRVPGLPTFGSQFLRMPEVSIGSAVFYAPQVMQAQVEYRGLPLNDGKGTAWYVGAVAVPFCSEIGHAVWLQRPGHDWEGPFLVADCTRRNDLYGVVEFRDQVVEVDFDTAVLWGMARYGGKQNDGRWSTLTGRMDCVLLSKVAPEEYNGQIIDLSTWFLQNVEYAKQSENRHQIQNYQPPSADNPLPQWMINGQWISFP